MRLKMTTTDRPGLVHEVTAVLLKHGHNISAMEVGKNYLYVDFEGAPLSLSQLKQDILRLRGFRAVEPVGLLPMEERVRNLSVLLSAVHEGILSATPEGYFQAANAAACTVLQRKEAEILAQRVQNLFSQGQNYLKALRRGEAMQEREVIEESGAHYFLSAYPILDDHGLLHEALFVLRNMEDVHRLYRRLTAQPTMGFENIIYQSAKMRELVATAKNYARMGSTILIRGATGTGKELFARAIHDASPRREGIFLAINCASIPESLLESELFGYTEGSFTGGKKGGKPGLFELANGGTLFLDEIGELSMALQAKLLRVLQEHKVRRLGGRHEFAVDIRIITATHRPLEKMLKEGNFRADLFYRLNVVPLYLPTLRERAEDIPVLACFLLRRFSEKMNLPKASITEEAMHKLCTYAWPGNIRELENIIERALNLTTDAVITPAHIRFDSEEDEILPLSTASSSEITGEIKTLKAIVAQAEREALQNAARQYKSARQMAKVLGLSHTSILRKLHAYGIALPKAKGD